MVSGHANELVILEKLASFLKDEICADIAISAMTEVLLVVQISRPWLGTETDTISMIVDCVDHQLDFESQRSVLS